MQNMQPVNINVLGGKNNGKYYINFITDSFIGGGY